MNQKINIRNLTLSELIEYFHTINEQVFRAKQVFEWLWKKNVHSFDDMTNLGKVLRDKLKELFFIDYISLKDQQISTDRTIKCAFSVDEGKIMEGVLIPTSSRMTACISSQIGCSLTCSFCATGRLKLLRNLSVGEIYDQVVFLKNQAEQRYEKTLTNIVFMGMGEPLLNYKNVLKSIQFICSDDGLSMSARRITLSTAGIAKMIRKLGDDEVKFNLAISLHAANDQKRNQIMEINETNNLKSLSDSLIYFFNKTKSRITFEYIIFRDFNDSIVDAAELANFVKCVPCKINIIEYNPIENGHFKQADSKKVEEFAHFLESKNLIVNIRRSRGKDIDAACGQLANKNKAINPEDRKLKKQLS